MKKEGIVFIWNSKAFTLFEAKYLWKKKFMWNFSGCRKIKYILNINTITVSVSAVVGRPNINFLIAINMFVVFSGL